ncbi:MAG: PQQ-binding-like beta-propeller repeat protein [Pirellulaceae bacterium]|nr:PQQ-binding-like beta-propeller repeat protein [Pirellulaceae bacterium]
MPQRATILRLAMLCFCLGLLCTMPAAAAPLEWPQFRGPDGQGHSDATGLPGKWSETENVVWKTPVPGRGWSSPVIGGEQIWMTTAITTSASDEQKQRSFAGRRDANLLDLAASVNLRAICVHRESGKLLHDVELFQVDAPEPIHALNSYASPTPVLEAGRLYCHFGSYGIACVDTSSGQVLWRNQQLKVNHQNGPGASPAVWQDLLIAHFDGIDQQFVVALDKHSGQEVWRTRRSGEMHPQPEYQKAYCTPQVLELAGRWQLLSPAADWLYSYDPATGRELWRASYGKLGFSTVPRPLVGHGLVYVCTSFVQSRLLAVRYDGQGDVTATHVAWFNDRQVPKMPSLLLVGDELYMFSDNGIVTCLDAKTGEEVWRDRLAGNFSASPLYAEGRIYISNREGSTYVLKPGRQFELLAENSLDGQLMASPAAIDGALFYRSDTHLYRLGTPASPPTPAAPSR